VLSPDITQLKDWQEYAVDRLGNVYSNKTGTWIKLVPYPDPAGYLQVGLHFFGVRYVKQVHILILETYVGPCPPGLEGCHKDDNKSNNSVTNLRWDTHVNNCADRRRNGNHIGSRKLTDEQVLKIREMCIIYNMQQKYVAKLFDITPGLVYQIVNYKIWQHLKLP
jgi:hypothetical protein